MGTEEETAVLEQRTMTAEAMAMLRAPFPPGAIGKLPRVTCGECRNARGKVCERHQKSKCKECDNWITSAHIHLDYVGHADATARLLEVDPEWTWQPLALDQDGLPAVAEQGANAVLWINLTICGVSRLGVGTAPKGKDDLHKELIGDALRNAAMRFGVALDLWARHDLMESTIAVDDEAPARKAPAKRPARTSAAEPSAAADTAPSGADPGCPLCSEALYNDKPVATYEGQRCHKACVKKALAAQVASIEQGTAPAPADALSNGGA